MQPSSSSTRLLGPHPAHFTGEETEAQEAWNRASVPASAGGQEGHTFMEDRTPTGDLQSLHVPGPPPEAQLCRATSPTGTGSRAVVPLREAGPGLTALRPPCCPGLLGRKLRGPLGGETGTAQPGSRPSPGPILQVPPLLCTARLETQLPACCSTCLAQADVGAGWVAGGPWAPPPRAGATSLLGDGHSHTGAPCAQLG